jgi:Thioredoxin
VSGTQSRQRRRARAASRPVPRARRHASPKILLGIAVLVVLIGVTVGLASVFVRGTSANPLTGAAEARTLFRGLPQHGNVLGLASAPVTLVEYADLQCPYCRDFELQTTPALVTRYVRNGKLKVVFRPPAFIGPDSIRGRDAVIAAGLQGKLFETVQLLYLNQRTENTGWLDDRLVDAVATAVPSLDRARLRADMGAAVVAQRAHQFDVQATAHRVRSPPTLLVGRSGEPLHRVEPAQLAVAVDAALTLGRTPAQR